MQTQKTNQKKISKKIASEVLRFLLLAGLFFFFLETCCPPKTPEKVKAPPPKKTHQIKKEVRCVSNVLASPGFEWKKRLIDEQLAIFDFENPSIKISNQWVTHETLDSVINTIVENIKNKEFNYDVIPMTKRIYDEVSEKLKDPKWGKKHLVNFYKVPGFVEAHNPEIFSINDLTINTGSILTGPYLQGYHYGTWYNAELGKKIGLNLSGNVLHFEDLLSAIKKINTYNETAPEPIYPISAMKNDYSVRLLLFNFLLSSVADEEGNLPQSVNSTKQKLAMLHALKQLQRLAVLKPFVSYKQARIIRNSIQENEDQNKSITERSIVRLCLMNNRAVFLFHAIVKPEKFDLYPIAQKDDSLLFMELPSINPVNFSVGHFSESWAVLKNSPNAEEGIKLMEFWIRPELPEIWTQASRNITCLKRTLYTASNEIDIYGKFMSYLDQKYGSRIMDIASCTENHFNLFDFSFSNTMELIRQLENPRTNCRQLMETLLKDKE